MTAIHIMKNNGISLGQELLHGGLSRTAYYYSKKPRMVRVDPAVIDLMQQIGSAGLHTAQAG